MEKATRMLNLLSAVIMFFTGLYIHVVFSSVLSPATMILLWTGILFYAGMQIEFEYGVIRKQIEEMLR